MQKNMEKEKEKNGLIIVLLFFSRVLCPAVLVKTRVCEGCSVSQAHKPFLGRSYFVFAFPHGCVLILRFPIALIVAGTPDPSYFVILIPHFSLQCALCCCKQHYY